jgi:hypothetical protein
MNTDENVPSKGTKQKKCRQKNDLLFVGFLSATDENGSADPQHWFWEKIGGFWKPNPEEESNYLKVRKIFYRYRIIK